MKTSIVALLILFFYSCKSLVDERQLRQVKRVAVVYAAIDNQLKNSKRPSRFAFEFPLSTKEKIELEKIKEQKTKTDFFFSSERKVAEVPVNTKFSRMNMILESTVAKTMEGLANLAEWQVLSFYQYIDTPAYIKLLEAQDSNGNIQRKNLRDNLWQNLIFHRNLLHPSIEDIEVHKDALIQFMSLLKLDGVIFLNLQGGFEPRFAVRGAGIANLVIDYSMRLLGKDGNWIVNSFPPDITRRGLKSHDDIPLLADTINFDAELQKKIEKSIDLQISERLNFIYTSLQTKVE